MSDAARWGAVLVVLVTLALHCKCQELDDPLTPAAMQLITEYASWRNLDHLLIFDTTLGKVAVPNNFIQLMDCLSQCGVYASMYSTQVPRKWDMFHISKHRLGIVVLMKYNDSIDDQDHIMHKASDQRLFGEQQAWLLISNNPIVNARLQYLSLGLTSDLVLATATGHHELTSDSTTSSTTKCPVQLSWSSEDEDMSPPKDNNIISKPMMEHNSVAEHLATSGLSERLTTMLPHYELVQMYKIRRDDDSSFVFTALGSWGMSMHFENVRTFIPVEGRQNLMGFPLVVGYKNWTAAIQSTSYQGRKSEVYDTDVDDTKNLQEIMKYIAKSLNATVQYKAYPSVGTEIQDGVWSDLLKAVVTEKVDFGLAKVTVTYNKLNDMAFTHVIMKSSYNIYMHPPELSVSKDIYLTPFTFKLLLSVLGMAILLALIMFVDSLVANYKARQLDEAQLEDVNMSYATLWIVGILTMQGSIWTPITSSGNMILISSLMFALIIYNSYAAFITSILSVTTSDITTLEDLFANDYRVGYIQNSHDEIYLQSLLQKQTNDLHIIYLRGYNSRVHNIETGLLKAATSRYALFISTSAARHAIQVLNPYTCRCQIQEFVLRSTEEDVAFPLSKSSPYHKIINLGVMRLKESGILSKIHTQMLPNMPMCSTEQSFVSAQFGDILSAVGLFLAGVILALIISIIECIISYRRELTIGVRQKTRHFCVKIKEYVRNFEF
ncbi:grik [Carabus blaptoides fortunei]